MLLLTQTALAASRGDHPLAFISSMVRSIPEGDLNDPERNLLSDVARQVIDARVSPCERCGQICP